VAYKLNLPPDTKIHSVVHVSQLKKQVPPAVPVNADLASVSTDPMQSFSPEQVLNHRVILRGATTVPQMLIQWSGLPQSMATWEDKQQMARSFPGFTA